MKRRAPTAQSGDGYDLDVSHIVSRDFRAEQPKVSRFRLEHDPPISETGGLKGGGPDVGTYLNERATAQPGVPERRSQPQRVREPVRIHPPVR